MSEVTKKNIIEILDGVEYLPNRTPEMAFSGGSENAFAEISRYRNGAIFVGFYSGNSEWERHSNGDEIVMALEGETTLVLLDGEEEVPVHLRQNELVVVPQNTWHRFKNSEKLKLLSVTPQPTDHSLDKPAGGNPAAA